MGQTTPNGVTELKTSPQEQNPAAGFGTQPDDFANITNEFFTTLENAVAADPAAEDAVNLLIREIQETTGLHTDDPDMQAQAATRIEQLNTAIQDSNMPEEIKASFDNVYTASMDSPQYLNVLNGFILQGGGSIAGIAGAAQRLDEERVAKRNESDNRASAAATASLVYTVQERIQEHLNEFFERNAEMLAAAMEAAREIEQTQGAEAAAIHLSDQITPELAEEYQTLKEEYPDLTVEQFMSQASPTITDMAREHGVSPEAAEASLRETESRLQEMESGLSSMLDRNKSGLQDGYNFFAGLMADRVFEIDLGIENPESPAIETKDDLIGLLNAGFEETANRLSTQQDNLNEMKETLESLQQRNQSTVSRLMAAQGDDFETLLDRFIDESDRIREIEEQIAEQEYLLSLQTEINDLSKIEVDKILSGLDNLSDIDVDFLKQAIINMDPELLTKIEELNERLGIQEDNPIAQMQALLENQGITLTDDQRADLEEFLGAVTAAREDVESAQAWKDNERERAEYAAMNNPDGIYIPQNYGMEIGFSPIAQTDGRYLAMAMEEERNALANLASLRLGVEADALPEFAVEQEAVLQQLSRETSIDQSQINDILVGMGLYGDNLDAANAHIAQNLINQHNIEVTGSLPSEEPAVISGPEPEAPSSLLTEATLMAQELAAMESVSRADFENILYRNNWDGPSHDDMAAMLEAELRELKPDFEFAEMSLEDQIIMAFIENQGTLSQQDIQLVISEAGIEGTEFQAVFDEMVAKYSNHQDFSIDPPIASAADEYAPDEQDIAAADPAAAKPSDPQPLSEEQEYAHTHTGQSPTVL